MKKYSLLSGLLVLSLAAPAHAQLAADLLKRLGTGTVSNLAAGAIFQGLTDLGVFSAIGMGTSDPEVDAKLDQIINELEQVNQGVNALQSDVTNIETELLHSEELAVFLSRYQEMEAAKLNIVDCAAAIQQYASEPGSDQNDAYLRQYAEEIVGAPGTTGPCNDLMNHFQTIDADIIGDLNLSVISGDFYTVLGRLIRESELGHIHGNPPTTSPVSLENLASHFVAYALVQRQAVQLVRNAYSLLGMQDALQTVLTQPPYNLLSSLRDEEAAFLHGTDAYITTGAPSDYNPWQAALADAVVQRLEGIQSQVTTFSLSILPNGNWTPTLYDSAHQQQPMTDTVGGSRVSYYNAPTASITTDVDNCLLAQPTGPVGFSFIQPLGSGRAAIGSSCTVNYERHLHKNAQIANGVDWTLAGVRFTPSQTTDLPVTRLNAATLAAETAADNGALRGDPSGEASGAAGFNVVAAPLDPSVVILTVDLPDAPGTPVRTGTSGYAFTTAGTGAVAQFTRVPYGPAYPNRYELAVSDQFVSIDSNGIATLGASPTWFDFQTTPDGHTELAYDGGLLYVDSQFLQSFWAETPDTYFANQVNVAATPWLWNTAAGSPNPPTTLSFFTPCVDANGNPAYTSTTTCSDTSYSYREYTLNLSNADGSAHTFNVSLSTNVSYTTNYPNGATTTAEGPGYVHCFIPNGNNDLTDTGGIIVASGQALESPVVSTGMLTIPTGGSVQIDCIAGDDNVGLFIPYYPPNTVLDYFDVTPCRPNADGSALVSCSPYL